MKNKSTLLVQNDKWSNPEFWERAIWLIVRITLAAFAAASILWVSGEHLVASITHAEIDPCFSSDGYTPDDELACTAWWNSQSTQEDVLSFTAPRGWECHEIAQIESCSVLVEYTDIDSNRIFDIIMQAVSFYL